MQKKLLGNAHPHIANSQWNLGSLYQKQDTYQQAQALYVEALSIARVTLGSEHRTTKSIQSSLNSLPQND